LSTVYLPIEDMIATAIDQAVRLANSEPVAPIPPFTGTLILRESVAAGPFFQRPA
ncbi:LacI family transcriptional regulator, partial [Salmonella enterica]